MQWIYVLLYCIITIISLPPGKERLAGCLGITPLQASQFIESFMQKYKKVHEFTKKTIEQCRNKGNPKSVSIFLYTDQHCVTVVKTKIQLDPNSDSYRTKKKTEQNFLMNQVFFFFKPKRSWLNVSAFSQKDANRIRHLFSE